MKRVKILSAVAVFIGATCCFWVSLLALIGLGSFGLVPNPFVGLGLGFLLLLASYLLYFHQRRKCAKEGCLTPQDNMTKLVLGISTIFLLLFATYTAFPYLSKGKSVKECCAGGIERFCKLFGLERFERGDRE